MAGLRKAGEKSKGRPKANFFWKLDERVNIGNKSNSPTFELKNKFEFSRK
jgi:hypothetical protein